ncbi:hypothetical protein DSO57_1001658 [Entomophthora muscae]|uniref:Uncharacterized protein n=1 Tax=Entomophthora muscae TaxID=34485 RepID=A0ACC2TWC8_9FUNG|nr:hypothetical protein DSO57_1001658 [Entomophthora muscae]
MIPSNGPWAIFVMIITGRWGPAVGNLLLSPPNVKSMPANIRVVPPTIKTETLVLSQCKSLSYIVNLAPILCWALPSGPVGYLPASSHEPPTR